MRLASYNILDGGEGRADPLAEVLLAQAPDIVALVESDNLQVLSRIARRGGFDLIHAPGPKHASALLTRWTIDKTINYALLRSGVSKSFLEATLIDPAGAAWIVAVVHLHAHARMSDEAVRLREIEMVLEALAPHRDAGRAHLLCGDFNSVSPQQQIDIARCKPATQVEFADNGGQLPRAVVQRLFDAGYVDTLAVVRPDVARSVGTFSTQHPGQRVDYIFAWGFDPARLRDAWIETDRLATYASDHYPVGVEIASPEGPS